jgi:hypothetical protein
LTRYSILLIIFLFAALGCGQNEEKSFDRSSQNMLLQQSLDDDYETLKLDIDFRGYTGCLPLNLHSKFDFIKEEQLETSTAKKLLLDTLAEIEDQLDDKYYFSETDLKLCKAHISQIAYWLKDRSSGSVERVTNEVLQLEKFILFRHYQKEYYIISSSLDSFAVKLIPESNEIKFGDPYRAKVYFVGYETAPTSDVLLYEKVDTTTYRGIGFIDTIPIKRGENPMIEFYPKKTGTQSLGLLWSWKTLSGKKRVTWMAETEFEVTE